MDLKLKMTNGGIILILLPFLISSTSIGNDRLSNHSQLHPLKMTKYSGYPNQSLQPEQLIGTAASAAKDEELLNNLLPDTDYPSSLASLVEYFEGNGVDLEAFLEDSRFEIYEGIGDRFRHSAEKRTLTLEEYKRILGYENKRSQITDFINTHYDQLLKAEENYDISRYVIAAIIGIESDFGKNIGSFNPFNAYVSMYAEEYRGEFARAQLEELLKFTKRNQIDVFELKSSYAGAMSFAQFIPYSLNKWFVGDDIFDMNNNIFSVANYLAHFKDITGTMDGAVMRYNPSRMYTDAVLDLARDAEAIYTAAR